MDPSLTLNAMLLIWGLILLLTGMILLSWKKNKRGMYAWVGGKCASIASKRKYLVFVAFLYILPPMVPPHLVWVQISIMSLFLVCSAPLVLRWMCFSQISSKDAVSSKQE